MPAKRRSASGKGATKEPQAATRRSTRGSSAANDTKSAAGAKRKASPSPSPAPRRAASAKKGRTRSPSPALVERPRRARSTTKKEEPKPAEKPASRSASSQKGRVTRNVVQEVEVKKSTETKSRSTSRSAKSTTTPKGSADPKNKAVTPKKKEETPKKKETPKQKVVSQRGRSTTPRNAKVTPREKAVTPKQKSVSPKQKTTPKEKQPTPQKAEPVTKKNSAKSSPVKEQKLSSPQRTPRSRRSKQDEEPVDNKPDEKVSSDDDKIVSIEAAEGSEKDEALNQEKEVEELGGANEESQQLKTDEKEEDMEKTEPEEKIEKTDNVENKDENETEETEEALENTEEALENKVKEDEKTEKDQSPEKEENKIAESENVKGIEDSVIGEEAMEASDTDETGQQEKTTESDHSTNMQEDSNKEFDLTESKQAEQVVLDEVVADEGTESNIESKDVKENEMNNFVENAETEENSVKSVDNSLKEDSVDSIEINESGEDDMNKDTAVISQSETDNLVSAETNYGGGDQEQSKKVAVEEISDDDIEEIDTKQENGAANIDDDIEEIEFVEQVDKYVENTSTKRKFDDVDTESNDSSPVKKVRVSTEEGIHENGSSSQEDIAKDYVVIEMSDVPQATSSEVQSSLPNPIFNRTFIPNPTFSGASDSSKQFSVVSYNMLADCHLFKNDYSFTEARFLQPEYRLKKVIEELRYLDGDIVCMQEVDPQYFADQLLPSMRSLGYEGVHKQREAEYYNEGEATFFKISRFEVIETEASSFSRLLQKELEVIEPTIQEAVKKYTDLPDVIIVAKLKCKNTGREVTIGNVHIQWGEMKVPDAQCVQIASAVKEIVSKATGDNFPHIICGDFNSPPMSPGYLVARDGYPSGDETINTLMKIENLELPDGKKASLVNSLWPAFQHTSSSLRSAYSEAQGYEPEITSYNCVMCNCVDYIFYSSMSLENVGVLQTASKEKIMETGGIPNCYFPSDHVSLKSVLSFK